MLRKLALALVAVLSLAAPASAHGSPGGHGGHFGGHHFRHFGHHFHGDRFFRAGYLGDPCYRTVFTEFGPRTIDICE